MRITLFFIFLCSNYAISQNFSATHQIFIDSLTKQSDKPVFVFQEFAIGVAKISGERNPPPKNKSCSWQDESWIFWSDETLTTSKLSNYCYDQIVSGSDTVLLKTFDELFRRAFENSNLNEITINSASSDQMPISGRFYYKITRHEPSKEFSICFDESLFLESSKLENPGTLEYVLFKLRTQFEVNMQKLSSEGAKIEVNWH